MTIARRSTDRIQRLVSSLLDINRLGIRASHRFAAIRRRRHAG